MKSGNRGKKENNTRTYWREGGKQSKMEKNEENLSMGDVYLESEGLERSKRVNVIDK